MTRRPEESVTATAEVWEMDGMEDPVRAVPVLICLGVTIACLVMALVYPEAPTRDEATAQTVPQVESGAALSMRAVGLSACDSSGYMHDRDTASTSLRYGRSASGAGGTCGAGAAPTVAGTSARGVTC